MEISYTLEEEENLFLRKKFASTMKSGMTYTLFFQIFCNTFTFEDIIILPSFQYTYNKSFITSNPEIYGHHYK